MPGSKLKPQVVSGSAVGSFCILWLEHITAAGLPAPVRRSINCAFRYGVLDAHTGEPAVFVDERYTSSRLGSFVTSLGFPCFHPAIAVSDEKIGSGRQLRVEEGEKLLLSASVVSFAKRSELFPTAQDFQEFLFCGKRSFCLATKANVLNIVDLRKDETIYEPLDAEALQCELANRFASARFDSIFRTAGGGYEWEYIKPVDV